MCNMSGNPAYDGYGVINKGLWGHGKFRRLSTEDKLLFVYLLTGPETEPSGLFEISLMSLGDVVSESTLASLSEEGMVRYVHIDPQTVVVLVKGMYESIRDGIVLQEARQQALKVPPCSVRDTFVREHGIRPEEALESNLGMVEAVCAVTKMDINILSAEKLRRIDAISAAGYTPEQVMQAFGRPDGTWYRHDWRGKQRQWPSLSLVETEIWKLVDGDVKIQERVKRGDITDSVRVLQRKNAPASEAAKEISGLYGADVWKALRALHKWSVWSRMAEPRFEIYKALEEAGI